MLWWVPRQGRVYLPGLHGVEMTSPLDPYRGFFGDQSPLPPELAERISAEANALVDALIERGQESKGGWKRLHERLLRRYHPRMDVYDAMDRAVQWAAAHRAIEAASRPGGSSADLSFYGRGAKRSELRLRWDLTCDQRILALLSKMLSRRKKRSEDNE